MQDRQTGRQVGYPSIDRPWLKYYSEEAINGKLPESTIYEYMYENNKDYPDDIAINYLGRKITYKNLFENIDKTAAAFLRAGVQEKEIVTVALPSIPEALYCVYALNKIGAVANMIHPLPGKSEMVNYINEVQSRIVVIFEGSFDLMADSVSETTAEKIIVASPGDSLTFALKLGYSLKTKKPRLDGPVFQNWKDFISDGIGTEIKLSKKDSHEMAIISHTGGTTGEPKGVMLSDKNINAIIWQIAHILPVVRHESQMAVLPPFVNYSLVNAMLEPLALGNTAILLPSYNPKQLGKYVKKYRPVYISSIPPYWEVLLEMDLRHVDFSSLKYPFYGGEAMDAEKEAQVNDALEKCGAKNELAKGLGATEMVSVATLTPFSSMKVGNVGMPLPKVDIKIVQPGDCTELPYEREGEICFSGPTLMMGYFNNEEETNDVVKSHEDGKRWLHTGDLGYVSEDGVVHVTGRIKRIMITKGKDGVAAKFFPDRVEKAITSNALVESCCVIGVPDVDRVNIPKAFVVLKNKQQKTDTTIEEIKAACCENLPDYMVPEEIEILDELPRTSRGKVDYRALEEIS